MVSKAHLTDAAEVNASAPRPTREIKRDIDRLVLVQQRIAVIEQERDESPDIVRGTETKRAQLLLCEARCYSELPNTSLFRQVLLRGPRRVRRSHH